MKLVQVCVLAAGLMGTIGARAEPAFQQQGGFCPISASASTPPCATAITGCLCSVQGGIITSSLALCGGCRVDYDYSWSCTNPFDEGSASGTSKIKCERVAQPLTFGTCACSGGALITINFSCGNCSSN